MTMSPLTALKRVAAALSSAECDYCLVGGHAASFYRSQERFTCDVDFALVATSRASSRKIAEQVLRKVGLIPVVGVIPIGQGGKNRKSSVCLISSLPTKNEVSGLVDVILPELPWVQNAVARAQHNVFDLGFAKVPVITPEDLIIAKCYALENAPNRFQDLDDIKEIFKAQTDLDLLYLKENLKALDLEIPRLVKNFAPSILRR